MDLNWFVFFFASAVVAGTPLVLATMGELVIEKSGSLNLGVEGMMYMGAIIGFTTSLATLSPFFSMLTAAAAGVLGAMIFGFVTITLRANQIVTGLTLTLFGTGFAGFIGTPIVGTKAPDAIIAAFSKKPIPLLSDIPVLGPILFEQDILIYITYVLIIVVGIYIYKTRLGLNGCAVGENPHAADSLGISVTFYRYLHLVLGGALCGLAGGYLSLVYVPSWQDSMIAGRGWIAVALVIFSKWNPYKAALGALFFGGLDIIGFRLQRFDLPISTYVFDALPYLMTIIVLIADSVRKNSSSASPASLGTPYFREER